MGEWKTVDLAEVSDDISYGYTASAAEDAVGPKFLRITDIVDGTVNWATVPYCLINEKDMAKYRLVEGDIVIARTGATTGANYTIRSSDPKDVVFASYLIRYRIDRTKALPRYVGYCLRSSLWNSFVEGVSGGSAQPGANAKVLGSFAFDLPDLPEQRAIASVLSSLDAKIDLLHRQNKTLEAMAEALFRQWFVEEAEEGWSQRPLSTIATYLNGVACQKYPAKDPANRLPVLKIKELSTGITDSSDWATSEIDPKYHVVAGDVVFSWSATLMVKLWDGPKAVLNQHLFKVTSDEYPKWFYFMWTKHYVDEFVAIATSHATTFGHIKRGDLDEAMVLIPGVERLKEMTKVMDPLFGKHITNSAQIKSLTALRDTLLPKLMSGEVRVEHIA